MNRLDRFVILVTFAALWGMISARYDFFGAGEDDGRRPVPAEPPSAEDATPPEPTPERVRRPLPEADSDDPIFSVKTEVIPPHEVGIGTSFPVGAGLWLTARHVANADCRRLVFIRGKSAVPAQIKYLDPQLDLALLQSQSLDAPALPFSSAAVEEGETGYSFGYPHGDLGGYEASLLGRSRMQFEGRLQGTTPVVVWAEARRFPEDLEELGGISGGPMFDTGGNIIGITVAASIRRGRTFTVAPEILHDIAQRFALAAAAPGDQPAQEVEAQPVQLGDVAAALAKNARIVETICVPQSGTS